MTAGTHRPGCPGDFLCDCGLEEVLALLTPHPAGQDPWTVVHQLEGGATVVEPAVGEVAACARMLELSDAGIPAGCWPARSAATGGT